MRQWGSGPLVFQNPRVECAKASTPKKGRLQGEAEAMTSLGEAKSPRYQPVRNGKV